MTNGLTPADDGSGTPVDAEPRQTTPEEDRPPTDADYGVAFSPRQVAGGFAILAALLALIVGLRRGRKRS
jgi:hypothetical protein